MPTLASNEGPRNGKCGSSEKPGEACHWCAATDELVPAAAGYGLRYDPLRLVYVCEDRIGCLERLVRLPVAA